MYPFVFRLPDKGPDGANTSGSRFVNEKTGPDGIATFDWLPPVLAQTLTFQVLAEGYHAPDRTNLEPEAPETPTLTSVQYRKGVIRGRVTLPDGGPAEGLPIVARGVGGGFDNTSGFETVTETDGTYEIAADPTQVYIIAVADDEWAAPSHVGVVVQEGWEVGGIDFHLGPGAVIRGRVTLGPENKPVEGKGAVLSQNAGTIPEQLKRGDESYTPDVHYVRWAYTDADGRYTFRVGPGTYTVNIPGESKAQEVEAVEGETYEINIHQDRLLRGPVSGRVVRADDPSQGVAGARGARHLQWAGAIWRVHRQGRRRGAVLGGAASRSDGGPGRHARRRAGRVCHDVGRRHGGRHPRRPDGLGDGHRARRHG